MLVLDLEDIIIMDGSVLRDIAHPIGHIMAAAIMDAADRV
jgi:hypothetical protein